MVEAGLSRNTQPSKTETLLRIGAAAKRAGVSRQALGYYLLVGLVKPACRSASGHRLFDQDCISRIKLIRKLNRSGYTLRDIRETFLSRQRPPGGQ